MTRFRTVQGLNPANWLLIPAAASLAATVLLATPVKVFGLQLPEPVFAMAPAFAWAAIRPSVLPPLLLAVLGVADDLVWGGPLGLWPLCLLATYGFAFSIRRSLVSEDFWVLAIWYGGACALAFIVGAALCALAAGTAPSLIGVALQWGVTVALFPLVWLLVERFEDADVRFR